MRVGIVGTGGMGATHAKSWRETPAQIAGFVSRQGRSDLAAEYAAPVFGTLEAMLPHVDVVDICTPTNLHHAQCVTAAQAGKHVICEKPFASSHVEAEEMIRVCAAHGVQLLVAHVLRYFPAYAEAQAAIANGQIGPPRLLQLRRAGSMPARVQDNWFADTAISGGVLLDLLIHDFDFAQWVAGPVAEVTLEYATPDLREATVMLRHKSGAVSRVQGAWTLPAGHFETSARIEGDNGIIAFDNSQPVAGADPYVLQAQAFYAALTEGVMPRVTAQDALNALDLSLNALAQATKI